jgi:hypothetical protein
MKCFNIKTLGRALLLAAIMLFSLLLLTGCSDYEKLDGVWTREDIDVKFQDDYATFTRIDPNSGWEPIRKNGSIRIGDKKFRNIIGGNFKWTGQELSYNPSTYAVGDWNDCTITMDEDGQTLYVYTPNQSNSSTIYTRK